jgi:heat shock protein HslJ
MVLAGCNGLGSARIDPLDGTSWILLSLEATDPLPGIEITAAFENGLVHGSSGCNSFGAAYSVTGVRISIREMQSTLMACVLPEGAMDQEQRFVTLFGSSDNFELSDGQLRLLRSNEELLVFFPQE